MRRSASFGRWTMIVALAVSSAVAIPAAAGASGAVPDPTVSGPIGDGVHGGPWFASLFDLAPVGYVEEEYFIEGTATAVSTGEEAPYKTRILVRRPVEAKRFSGTLVVEWLNVSGGVDLEFMWAYAHELFLRERYAFADVSVQKTGVDALKVWDPVRYGSLSHPGDEWSLDIFSQAAEALRDPVGVEPLGGLVAERVLATGTSQSGGHLVRYVNTAHQQAQVYDGFLVHSGDGIVRDDVLVPVMKIMSPGDDPRQPQDDTDHFRFWEEAGSAHNVHHWWEYGRQVLGRDLTSPLPTGPAWEPDPTAACPGHMNMYPRQYTARAGFHHLDRWVRDGTLPPVSPRFTTDENGVIQLDEHGNTRGGLRLPVVEVPLATYTPDDGCLVNSGTTVPFSVEKIRSLYPTHRAYLSAVRDATSRALDDGFILRPEAKEILAEAAAFDVWS